MGGLITAESIEKYPDIYNAGIPMCGVMAGATEFFDYLLDVGLAYDVAFGWPPNWGTVEDVRDKVDIWTHVLPVTTPQTLDPANIGQNEFVRLVSDLQFPGYYLQLEEGYGFLVLSAVMVHARADIEQRTGGNPSQNIDQVYSLSADELAYLMNLGVDAQSLLDSMNARTTITADVKSRKYLQRYADLTGRINKPMLTLHTMYDPVTPEEMVSAYAEQVSAMGNEAYLTRVYTSGEGHCSFTPQQLLRAFQGMEIWLDTGYAPGADFFPESLGFDNDFEPGPWE
jgi:pimeloyl-ACP methyl ester carboxylesterase